MICKTYYLKDLDQRFAHSDAYFIAYRLEFHTDLMDKSYPRPGLVVVAGGGYQAVSDREGEPVALSFLLEGFNTFVMKYSTCVCYPTPHEELGFVLNYINEHACEFNIISDKTSIIGFSAGGHLVASYGYSYKEQAKTFGFDAKHLKPFAIIAGYPVILTKDPTHLSSIMYITDNYKPELMKKMDVITNIAGDYPPTYVFSTECDEAVPIVNSYEYIKALDSANVHHAYHIFPKGIHGGSLYTRGVYHELPGKYEDIRPNTVWAKEATDFIYDLLGSKL